jgi:very-short-patch-repair endonuclease
MKPRKKLPPPLDSEPFTTRQGLAAGLGRERMRGSDLVHPFRGVYAADRGDTSVAHLCRILQSRLPTNGFFCGVTAASIMRLPLPSPLEQSRVLHVAVPAPRTAPTGKGVRGHSVRVGEGDTALWNGLRVSAPERAWCELGPQLTVPQLVAIGDHLVHWRSPITSTDALRRAVERFPSPRGRRALLSSLALLDDRSESPKESELRVILVQAGLTGLVTNLPIVTSDGYRYRADLAFPERKTIVEYQSRFHDTAANFRADMTRISRLEADGWVVIQVNNDDLQRPEELVRRIRRVLASRPSGA